VNLAILHDDDKVLLGICNQIDIGDRVAVNKQQISEGALLHLSELPRIWIAFAGHCQQFGVGPGGHSERFGGSVPADKRGQNCPLFLRQRFGEQDIGAAVLILYFFASSYVRAMPGQTSSALARCTEPTGKPSLNSSGRGCRLSHTPFSAINLAVASSIRKPCSIHLTPAAMAR